VTRWSWLAALPAPAATVAVAGDGGNGWALISVLAVIVCFIAGAASALQKINADLQREPGTAAKVKNIPAQLLTDMLGSIAAGMLAFFAAADRGIGTWMLLGSVLLASYFGIAIFNWLRDPLRRALRAAVETVAGKAH